MEVLYDVFINALLWIYQLLGNNFGWAIIVFTLLTRVALYPFTKQQLESGKAMQDLQSDPDWKKIQKKYAKDREKLAQEQMRLYQEKGINPFGSCLPTLLQFPLIIGIYGAVARVLAASPLQLLSLANDITLPDAASLLPLNSAFWWITDLSQPERLVLDFIPETWPIIGAGIPILAIVVYFSSYFQSKLITPTSSDPNDQQAQMNRSMTIMMPLMMAYFSYLYSAGLALYFVTSNLASILQYAMMGRLNLPWSKKEA